MRKIRNTLVAALVLTLMTSLLATAQSNPEELLQSAVYKEEVEGDLEAAIDLFEQIIKTSSQNRVVAAQALLHLGSSFEKLGNLKAEEAYQRLINDFGEQQTMVSEARIRLQKIRYRELAEGIQAQGSGPTYRIALDEDVPGLHPIKPRAYDFSPNGDQIVCDKNGALVISDATGTLRRQLVAKGQGP